MMGLSPLDVDRMTLWQFQAAADGFRRANPDDTPQAMSDERAAELGIVGF